MGSKHFFNLNSMKPQKSYSGGSLTLITTNEVPAFRNIAFSFLRLNKGFCQEAIWNPNANKIGYCQAGSGLVTILSPGSRETFTIGEGDVFFVPKGFIHYIANAGDHELQVAFALNHEHPEMMTAAKAVQTLPDSVFAATFKTAPAFFEGIKKSKKDNFISSVHAKKTASYISSHYKFNINASNSLINVKGGYLKAATKSNLPVLNGLGILGFGLTPKGIVEPHWHTNAGELVYIAQGHARMSILDPDGTIEIAELKAGGMGFAPPSHFHSIDNIGKEDVVVIAFFTHEDPNYIGISEALSVIPKDLLASSFGVAPGYFDSFNAPGTPIVISGG
jgi:oxalate decarboxylase